MHGPPTSTHVDPLAARQAWRRVSAIAPWLCVAVFRRVCSEQRALEEAPRRSALPLPRNYPDGPKSAVTRITGRAATLSVARTTHLSPDYHPHPVAPQFAQHPGLHASGDLHHAINLRFIQHLRVAVQRREELPIPHGHADTRDRTERLGGGAEHGAQPIHAVRSRNAERGTRNSRGQHGMGILLSNTYEKRLGIGQQIGLVERVDHPFALDISIAVPRSALRVPH